MVKGVWIIAEVGVNHNGSITLAKQMIEKAIEAGIDCVKFQTFKTQALVASHAKQAAYQSRNLQGGDTSQEKMLAKLELTYQQFSELKAYCEALGGVFLSTPFDLESIAFLQQLGIPRFKIPSGELTNLPYLIQIARTGKDIILSTGMSTEQEIEEALGVLAQYGCGKITLLHCHTDYPTRDEDVNLKAMVTMKERFGVEVGYSDHTEGIEVALAAVALGATVIEKHFTMDKNMEGPDHKASIDPEELTKLVQGIRRIERALGDGKKAPTQAEIRNIPAARKSIVALQPIQKGDVLTEANIGTKRPAGGISPMRWFEVLGKKANKDFEEGEWITL